MILTHLLFFFFAGEDGEPPPDGVDGANTGMAAAKNVRRAHRVSRI